MFSDRRPVFSISIVSHGHRALILQLLDDLIRTERKDFELILTWNLKNEAMGIDGTSYPFRVIFISNKIPQGFAHNHNAAFRKSNGKNFVILNPDIRLPEDPFDVLSKVLVSQPDAICAPLIVNIDREPEDSARSFPSPWTLLKKAAAKAFGISIAHEKPLYCGRLLNPDWVAGMFMVIPRHIYKALNGLSEKYFLYYEDVDFCARARLRRFEVFVTEDAFAVHNARRESHRNLRFFTWHATSALKFFTSRAYLALKIRLLFKTRT